MGEPKVMFADIANDIADAEDALSGARERIPMDVQNSYALLSIAASQLAIAKLLLRREADE